MGIRSVDLLAHFQRPPEKKAWRVNSIAIFLSHFFDKTYIDAAPTTTTTLLTTTPYNGSTSRGTKVSCNSLSEQLTHRPDETKRENALLHGRHRGHDGTEQQLRNRRAHLVFRALDAGNPGRSTPAHSGGDRSLPGNIFRQRTPLILEMQHAFARSWCPRPRRSRLKRVIFRHASPCGLGQIVGQNEFIFRRDAEISAA